MLVSEQGHQIDSDSLPVSFSVARESGSLELGCVELIDM